MHGFVRVDGARRAAKPTLRSASRRSKASARRATGSTARAGSVRRSRRARRCRTREALGNLVHNGTGTMPAVGNTWDDRMVNALADYLKVKFGGTGGG